jgi:hypothetical protein
MGWKEIGIMVRSVWEGPDMETEGIEKTCKKVEVRDRISQKL